MALDFTVSPKTWAILPVDQTQKDRWAEVLAAGTKAQARRERLNEAHTEMKTEQQKALDALAGLEQALDSKMLAWAEGKASYESLLEHQAEISEAKSLVENIKAGLAGITKAIAHETKSVINRADAIKSQINYLVEEVAKKEAKVRK